MDKATNVISILRSLLASHGESSSSDLTEGHTCHSQALRSLRYRAPEARDQARVLSWPVDPNGSLAAPAFFRGLERRLGSLLSERSQAKELCQSLLAAEPARRGNLIRRNRRYQQLGVCDEILSLSLKASLQDAAVARELAELALDLLQLLSVRRYGAGLLRDSQARAWAHLGNAFRVAEDLTRARAAFHAARAVLAEGSGDPYEEAHLLQLEALLLTTEGKLVEAETLLDRVLAIYRHAELLGSLPLPLLCKAYIRSRREDLESAIRLCGDGLELIDPIANSELAAAAWRSLIGHLKRAGRFFEAKRELSRFDLLPSGAAETWAAGEGIWLRAKIAQQRGWYEEAESALGAARHEFLRHGERTQAVHTTCELAALYVRQGRREELLGILRGQLAPMLAELKLPPEVERVTAPLLQPGVARRASRQLFSAIANDLEDLERERDFRRLQAF